MANIELKQYLLRSVLVAAISSTLISCSSGPLVQYPAVNDQYITKGHDVSSEMVSETMSQGDGEAGLAIGELKKLDEFAAQFVANGSGAFTIIVPEGGDRMKAISNAETIREYSLQSGIRTEELDLRIAKLGDQDSPVVMSYEAYSVTLPNCGKFLPKPSYNPENKVASDLGCSVMNNIALMTANPADLVKGRIPTKPDGNVAGKQVEDYRFGNERAPDQEN